MRSLLLPLYATEVPGAKATGSKAFPLEPTKEQTSTEVWPLKPRVFHRSGVLPQDMQFGFDTRATTLAAFEVYKGSVERITLEAYESA